MRRTRRRPTYYYAHCLKDGTVIAAYPVRKPTTRMLKRDKRHIDDDNICAEFDVLGDELSDVTNDKRIRFQDIVSNALNVRRAVRQLVLPRLEELESQLASIRAQLGRVEGAEQDQV